MSPNKIDERETFGSKVYLPSKCRLIKLMKEKHLEFFGK